MKRAFFLLIAVFFLLNNLPAQNCPPVTVSGPSSEIKAGEGVSFFVNVSGTSITYNWMISSGTIESGQGTNTIKVNTAGLAGQNITATVELGGLPAQCSRTSSYTISIEPAPATELHLSGNYTNSKAFSAEAILFAGDIMSGNYILDSSRAVVFLYPGRSATAANAIRDMTSSLKAAFARKGLKPAMYTIKTAGKRDQTAYEMWIVPGGATEPVATPEK